MQLALTGDGLGLVLVVVDAADDQRRTVPPRQRDHRLEPGLAVLQVDGVDDRLAGRSLQSFLQHLVVGGVEHDGDFYFF